MEEMRVIVTQKQGTISFNSKELRERVLSITEAYENINVTEEDVPEAKKTVATLRKISKSIDKRRIEVKKEAEKPIKEFEKEVKEINSLLNVPINNITIQVEDYEKRQKEEKINKIKEIYNTYKNEYTTLEKVWSDKWENKTYTMNEIEGEITYYVDQTTRDINTIKNMKSDVEEKAIKKYLLSGLSEAINYIQEYEQQKKEIEKAAQEKAERMAAQAKIAEEEARKKAEEKRAIEEEVKKQAAIKQAVEEERARIEAEKPKEETFEDVMSRVEQSMVREDTNGVRVTKTYNISGEEETILKALNNIVSEYDIEVEEIK